MNHLLSRAETRRVLGSLETAYPNAKCALNFGTPFQLLIATMLSAQCTDVRVNMVTEKLFQKYKEPADFASLTAQELGQEIKEVGLFRTKAEHIIQTAQMLLKYHRGEVPKTQEELTRLPGVGRKTANVVVSNAYGVPALAVDTHVQRVSNRIGLANSMNPEITEKQLCQRIPKKFWSQAHHWLIFHGRQVCSARNPKCSTCPVQAHCQFYKLLETEDTLRAKVFEADVEKVKAAGEAHKSRR